MQGTDGHCSLFMPVLLHLHLGNPATERLITRLHHASDLPVQLVCMWFEVQEASVSFQLCLKRRRLEYSLGYFRGSCCSPILNRLWYVDSCHKCHKTLHFLTENYARTFLSITEIQIPTSCETRRHHYPFYVTKYKYEYDELMKIKPENGKFSGVILIPEYILL